MYGIVTYQASAIGEHLPKSITSDVILLTDVVRRTSADRTMIAGGASLTPEENTPCPKAPPPASPIR